MKPEQIVNEALTSPIYKLLRETPLQPARRLSALIGSELLLKREDLLQVFSFKVRGASHKMLKLPDKMRKRGVVAASAGNHAQGVAFAARAVGVPAHIFIPVGTPEIKVEAIRSLGANTIIDGDVIDTTLANAQQFARTKKLPFFHPFDDYDIICGQATVGAELLREMYEQVEAVFVCCGGGGLLAGVATVIKHLRPSVKVIGVEPDDAASMTMALRKGKLFTLPYVGTFAETVAVARAGAKTFKLCKQFVDDMVLVDSGSICNAIKEIYEDTRTIAEFNYRFSHEGPASVLAGISIKDTAERKQILTKLHKNGIKALDLTGDENAQFHVRHMVGGRAVMADSEQVYRLEFSERPGSLHDFLANLDPGWNISMFHYRSLGGIFAKIMIGFQLPSSYCKRLESRFKKTCYSYQLINSSPGYRWFLADPSRKS